MRIFLTGFMGTGKSTVGLLLSKALDLSFFDLDHYIVEQSGNSIAELFEMHGEEMFRLLEKDMLAELAKKSKAVIATGGGALLNPDNRALMMRDGLLVCLTAKVSTLYERLKNQTHRPLLAGSDMKTRIEELLRARQEAYDYCPVQIATDEKPIMHVVDEIATIARAHSFTS